MKTFIKILLIALIIPSVFVIGAIRIGIAVDFSLDSIGLNGNNYQNSSDYLGGYGILIGLIGSFIISLLLTIYIIRR